MLLAQAQEALTTLVTVLETHPELTDAVRVRWRAGGRDKEAERLEATLPNDVCDAADAVRGTLPAITYSDEDLSGASELFKGPAGKIVLSWCKASLWRRDCHMASLLALAAENGFREEATAIARDRVVQGPLLDALACAPLLGTGKDSALPENAEARARLQILIREAGASAVEVPELGPWLWGSWRRSKP